MDNLLSCRSSDRDLEHLYKIRDVFYDVDTVESCACSLQCILQNKGIQTNNGGIKLFTYDMFEKVESWISKLVEDFYKHAYLSQLAQNNKEMITGPLLKLIQAALNLIKNDESEKKLNELLLKCIVMLDSLGKTESQPIVKSLSDYKPLFKFEIPKRS